MLITQELQFIDYFQILLTSLGQQLFSIVVLAGKEFNQLEKTLNFEGNIFYCYDASLACFVTHSNRSGIQYSLRSKKSCGILIKIIINHSVITNTYKNCRIIIKKQHISALNMKKFEPFVLLTCCRFQLVELMN